MDRRSWLGISLKSSTILADELRALRARTTLLRICLNAGTAQPRHLRLLAELGLSQQRAPYRYSDRGNSTSILGGGATFLGVVVTCVGVIQAVYKWGRRSHLHKGLGSRYANLRRKVQLFLMDRPLDLHK